MPSKRNTKFEKALNKFDIVQYLDDLNVDLCEKGKNVARNNVGIHCPFCGDSSYHLNIHLDSKVFACWRCPTVKGNLMELVRMVEGLPRPFAWRRVKKLLKLGKTIELPDEYNLQEEVENRLKEDPKEKKTSRRKVEGVSRADFVLPKSRRVLTDLKKSLHLHRVFLNYLKKRRFTPEELSDWGIEACLAGFYGMRLFIPVHYKGEIVNFAARDITDKAERKYLNYPNDKAIMSMKSVLYGYDYVKKGRKRLVLTEGMFDAIRVGRGKAIAMMSKTLTTAQQKMLKRLRPKEIVIMLDNDPPKRGIAVQLSDTWADARKIAGELSSIHSWEISIVSLPKGYDPGGMKRKEIKTALREREHIYL